MTGVKSKWEQITITKPCNHLKILKSENHNIDKNCKYSVKSVLMNN